MRYELTVTAVLEEPTGAEYVSKYDYGYGRMTVEVDEFISSKEVAEALTGGLSYAVRKAYNEASNNRMKRAEQNVVPTEDKKE